MELTEEHRQTIELTVRRLADIRAQREALDVAEKGLKAFLRSSLGNVSQYPAAGLRITIAPRRVFDPVKAERYLTDEQLSTIMVRKLDSGMARLTLPRDVYEKCLTEQESQVRIS